MKHNLLVSVHDLSIKPGSWKDLDLSISAHPEFKTDLIEIPATQPIDIFGKLESVSEGILATLEIETVAQASCVRCLDPIEFDCQEEIVQLYFYPNHAPSSKNSHHKSKNSASKSKDEMKSEEEEEDLLFVEGECIDLEPVIRDALLLDLPLNPLCDENCQGLCPDCGDKYRDLPADHQHQQIDPRWGALGDLNL